MAIIGTRMLDVVDWTPQLAAMIGIGVGIDYALLILNRFRLERGAGRDVRDATLVALDTSGRAVLFAGIVVVIAMLGMMLLGISFLYGPRSAPRSSVLATMLAALTLMPAILGSRWRPPDQAGGQRRERRPGPRRPRDRLRRALERLRGAPPAARRHARAGRADRARRCPALHMRLATSDASTYKKDDTTRIAYDLLKQGFGAGLQRAAAARGRAAQGGDQARAHADRRRAERSRTGIAQRAAARRSTRPATRRR